MALGTAAEVVALDRPLEALADRYGRDLDSLAGLEAGDGDVISNLHRAYFSLLAFLPLALGLVTCAAADLRIAEFDQGAQRGRAGLLQVAELGLGELVLGLDLIGRKLNGVVAVAIGAADSRDLVRLRLDHRDGHGAAVLGEDSAHAQLLADDRTHDQSRISTSTPAGRVSMRWSSSTVFGVGWWMSISRLWVRISKCSRESLSLNGERITT